MEMGLIGFKTIQQFYSFTKLHYRQAMSQEQLKHIEEHDLLGSLLDDIDELEDGQKNPSSPNRMQAFSAPPVFSEVNYKLDFDLLDSSTFESPDPEDQSIMEAFLKKQASLKSSYQAATSPVQSYRKMSCDSALYAYRDNNIEHSFNYYDYIQSYSPTEQLFMHLERVSEWARDQNGSRTVQDIFDSETDDRKNRIFTAIFKDWMSLSTDRFGNYVLQKVFEKGLELNKEVLLGSMWGSLNSLAMHPYGCRVIQKALEYIKGKRDKQDQFIVEISPNCLTLIQNQNGNHVIQKCFQILPHSQIQTLSSTIKQHLNILAYHTYGCRVIQKYLENYSEQPQCQSLLSTLLSQSLPLSQCQFGNYVMQHIVTKCKEQRMKVFQAFLSKVYELSTNKYASNVMEKAIQAPESTFCEHLADWFQGNTKEYTFNYRRFILLAKHQFGNYVVQSMVNRLPNDRKGFFKALLRENASEISKSQHGRHVLLQIENARHR